MFKKLHQLEEDSKILIIISEDISDQKICKILTDADYQIHCLSHPYLTEEDIFEVLNNESITLILLADRFSQFDSYRLGEKMQNYFPKAGAIPLIFLGSSDYSEDKLKAFNSGGLDYLCPPFDRGEVLTKINTLIELINLRKKVEKLEKELIEIKGYDPLTNLANEHHFREYLAQEWNICARERVSLGDGDYTMFSLILIAIDLAEKEPQSDQVLQEVAAILKKRLNRPKDLVARYEKEIFGVILPNTDSQGLKKLAEILLSQLEPLKQTYLVNFRLGGVSRIPARALSSEMLIDVALEALEKARDNQEKLKFLDTEEGDFED